MKEFLCPSINSDLEEYLEYQLNTLCDQRYPEATECLKEILNLRLYYTKNNLVIPRDIKLNLKNKYKEILQKFFIK